MTKRLAARAVLQRRKVDWGFLQASNMQCCQQMADFNRSLIVKLDNA